MKFCTVFMLMLLATSPQYAYCSIVIPESAKPISQPSEDKPYITAAEFRKKYPLSEDISSYIEPFKKADRYILEQGINGYSTDVTIVDKYKDTYIGKDYIFTGANPKIREVRALHEYIYVDGIACFLEYPKSWECTNEDASRFTLALKEIYPDAIIKWSFGYTFCLTGICTVYRYTTALTDFDEDGNLIISSDPTNNHIVFSLFIDKDGVPIMYSESEISSGEQSGLTATYLFDFKTPVADIKLPAIP